MKKFILFIGLMGITLTGCKFGTSSPDVNHVELRVQPQAFFIDLFEIDETHLASDIDSLSAQYGSYLDAYSQQIINIGSPNHPQYPERLKHFLNYEENREVYAACKAQYGNTATLQDDLEEAFRHYKYYFPEATIPTVYLHTSYFNQSIAMDSSWLSVSVEKYLGADCIFYEWLAVPKYLRRKMSPEKMVPDVMKAMALGNFSFAMKNEDLISNMLSQAKVLYFIKQMIPTINDTLLFDYSPDELRWCRKNEAAIWASMVEQKHLYNTERMLIQKYVGDSPFTYHLGQESPGRAAVFIAYKIIEAYLHEHPELTLSDLIEQRDAHAILLEARYRP
ncbi:MULTISPECIES: gliding motility protein GldB [unclassified Carboxylicivirga]|uniref:gliding motility lipoprotein GldB n=1 Tax=Carboxylicivirga TaxID=1628153 RepID=UPI003D33F805